MKIHTLVPAFGAAFALALAAPPIATAEVMQPAVSEAALTQAKSSSGLDLSSSTISASQFGTLFQPLSSGNGYTGFLDRSFKLPDVGINGSVRSEVFQGKAGTVAEGLYAYAVQVSSLATGSKQFNDLNGIRYAFNASPLSTLPITGKATNYLQIDGVDGTVLKNFAAPTLDGSALAAAADLNQQVLQDANGEFKQGSITADFNSGLSPAQNSSIITLLSKSKPAGLATVNIRGGEFVQPGSSAGIPQVWNPTAEIIQIPVPEPSAVLAWAGLIGGAFLARRYRRTRAA
jgi:hypothetical protein